VLILHPDETSETVEFIPLSGTNAYTNDYDFSEYHDFDEDTVHPSVDRFIADSAKWCALATTDRGLDNGCGGLYWSQEMECVCAINSCDDTQYCWNVAGSVEEIKTLWVEYSTRISNAKLKVFRGGFVDWLMDRPGMEAIYYSDLSDGTDPYTGSKQ
jgi:hypothetical protein